MRGARRRTVMPAVERLERLAVAVARARQQRVVRRSDRNGHPLYSQSPRGVSPPVPPEWYVSKKVTQITSGLAS
ncbi:hypothetical protein GCM10027212_25130 [Actinotalea caeni]